MPPRNDMERAFLRERIRLGILLAALLGMLLYLVSALYHVQIREHGRNNSRLERNSIRRVRLPATRGRILDRDGTPLAESAPTYSLGIFVQELRRPGPWSNTVNAVDALVDDLSAAIGRPRDITRENIQAHIRNRRPLALPAFAHLTETEIARFAENSERFPGVDIQISHDRFYPYGDCAAHLIGYVRPLHPEPADGDDPDEASFDYYLPDFVGKDGVEKAADSVLAGIPGGEQLRIDAVGYKHKTDSRRAPQDGADVTLSISLPIQRRAEEALGDRRGAVAIVDVRNGEVVALASAPRYDLSQFFPTLSSEYWKRLNADPDKPLYHRAAQGRYPPGSTIKPFVALTALEAGVATPGRVIDCTGSFPLGKDSVLRCGHRAGHGPIDLGTAIEQSCNVYFCQLGVNLGYEPALHDALAAIGLGTGPDLGIPAAGGRLPTSAWKRDEGRGAWTRGDTANLSIGQGYLEVTPLQMALATAAIANGGDLLRPRLFVGPGATLPSVVRHIPWKTASLKVVRDGMRRVIEAPKGGGRRAHVDGLELAGKTGTAEYGSRANLRKYTWMIAYGPFRNPEFAMAVVIEDGESGGKTAAPVVRDLFAALYNLEAGPGAEDDGSTEYHELEELPESPENPEAPETPELPELPSTLSPLPSSPLPSPLSPLPSNLSPLPSPEEPLP